MGWNDGGWGGGGYGGGGYGGGGGGGGGGSGLPVIPRDPIHNQQEFDEFGCDVPALDGPATPDEVTPDVVVRRDVYMRGVDVRMPDGKDIEVWGFHDPSGWGNEQFPSEAIRVREGQVVHTDLDVRRVHTIHHHGIEPTAFNDGVGHTSFEVSGRYVYQWRASQAGTYLYHCHVNTALHFEMGMYGLLIVDPPEGPGKVFSGGPTYDVEAFWVPDDIDPAWRDLRWDAGRDQCPFAEDVGLNDFNPEYFLITGVPHPETRTHPNVAVNCQAGQTVLVRLVNAGYVVLRVTIEGLDAEVVSMDGRPLIAPYAEPITLPADTPFELSTAQRWDMLLRPTAPGSYRATMEFLHWISGEVLGVAETFVNVA